MDCVAVLPRPEFVPGRNQLSLYLLDFAEPAEPATLQVIATALFSDPVIQTTLTGPALQVLSELAADASGLPVLTLFKPGVTDAVGESSLRGYGVLKEATPTLPTLKAIRTATLYYLPDLPEQGISDYVRRNLINDLIQDYVRLSDPQLATFLHHQFNFAAPVSATVRNVPIRAADDAGLLDISKAGLLALDLREMLAIKAYFEEEGRDPTDIELETLAQTWSEHCVHKTFKAAIDYTELDADGQITQQQSVNGLFKTGIAAPTEQLNKDWIVSAFSDNAGIIAFDDDYDLSFKAETHNHPSALEPFGGANTGLGGVIRDVMAVSAQPIAATDVFCFGPPATDPSSLPPEVLPPHKIYDGVVAGVRDYGNKMGIPTVNGAVLFDRGYIANPLVFCGTVGFAPHGSHPRNLQPGDRVIVAGGRTGRDGIHGATFSSIELGGETNTELKAEGGEQASSVVQIGNPIIEKKVLDMLLKARDAKLYSAVTDCGGGGLSSAVGEMGQETGVKVALENVPLKYAGLLPWEIWLSEAQERMLFAIPPANVAAFMELCQLEEVEASDIGEFTSDGLLTLNYGGQTVGQLKMQFLHHGLPRRELKAVWRANAPRPRQRQAHYEHHRPYQGYSNVLLKILSDPNVSSKEDIIRRYDHEVQGGSVIKPLVGIQNDGPGDAAVIRPRPDSLRGIAISNGINPRYGLLDPYQMAACAVDEAVRNAVAVGADLSRMALLDNFCWGNPNVPERLGELTRAVLACRDMALAYELPFISGKDSLNNEYRDPSGQRTAIPGTLLISAIAVIADVRKCVTMDFKAAGNLVYIVGATRPELGGSYYSKYHGQVEGDVPTVNPAEALATFTALAKAIQAGNVRSCHDLSEGGLAVAAAEMAFAGGLGTRLDLLKVPFEGSKSDRTNAALLFSETPSRFLVEVEPGQKTAFEEALSGLTFAHIGTVIEDDEFTIGGLMSATILRQRASTLKAAWQTPIF